MSKRVQPVKATILGGLVFLVPLVITIVLVGEMFKIMALLATPLSSFIPIDTIGGLATANVITVLSIILVCFIAGKIAMSGTGGKIHRTLDDKLLTLFPRYAFIKGMTEGLAEDGENKTLQTVLVTFDDQSMIGFEVERGTRGLVTVYLPGSPDPWSGTLAFVEENRVEILDASFQAAISSLRKAGQGAAALLG